MRSRIVAAAIVLTAGLLWSGLAACELVLPTVADDGATEAPDADTCTHVMPPARPDAGAGAGAGAGGTLHFFSAVQTFSFAAATDTAGYDLDGVCSCPSAPESCVPLSGAQEPHCDQPGGRDIEGNKFFGDVLQTSLALTGFGDIDRRIEDGRLTYLIEISNYNGEADDSEVRVAFYDSAGLLTIDDAGTVLNHPPSWDGGDTWSVDCRLSAAECPQGFIGDAPMAPGFFNPRAYVRENVLVAHLPIVIGLGFTNLRFADVVLTAKIEPLDGGGGYRMQGQLAGRIATHDAFVTLAAIHDGDGGGASPYLCGSNETFRTLSRPRLCASADINSDPRRDRTGAPCDALSVAIVFTALPARIGYRFDHDPPVQGCDGVIDDCKPE